MKFPVNRILILIVLAILILALFRHKVESFVKDINPPQTCTEAKARGLKNIPKGNQFYNSKLDKDMDNVICE